MRDTCASELPLAAVGHNSSKANNLFQAGLPCQHYQTPSPLIMETILDVSVELFHTHFTLVTVETTQPCEEHLCKFSIDFLGLQWEWMLG